MLQKERVESFANGQTGTTVLGNFGVLAGGTSNTVSDFEARFNGQNPPGSQPLNRSMFMQEFDWGTGPMVGQVETVNANPTAQQSARISAMEDQAKAANCSLVASRFGASTMSGYRFDPQAGTYLEMPAGTVQLTRAALINLVTGTSGQITFQAAPLGSERRLASPTGIPAASTPTPITNVTLITMAANSAFTDVPSLTNNWVPVQFGGDFNFTGPLGTPPSLKKLRQLQWAQIHASFGNGTYGLSTFRHDAPRRIRIAANGLQPGCVLLLGVDPATQPTTSSPGTLATKRLRFPLHPQNATHRGVPVWTSAVELDVLQYLILLAGGHHAPGVAAVLAGTMSDERPTTPGTFAPVQWNLHHVQLQNPGGPVLDFGWQRLSLN